MPEYVDKLPDDAVYMRGTFEDWITPNGDIYHLGTGGPCKKGVYFKVKQRVMPCGYKYVPIHYMDRDKPSQRRVHILVAENFVDNPDNLPIVGHKNNIKTDVRAENLYWTTVKENTQKANADLLMVNDVGIHDNQSQPVALYDRDMNLISVYGSISQAARLVDGYTKSTIAKVLDNKTSRRGYFWKTITQQEYYQAELKLKPVVCDNQIKKSVRPVRVTDTLTGEKKIFDNMVQVEKFFGFKRGQVRGYTISGNLIQDRYRVELV